MTHPIDKGFNKYWALNPISRLRAFFSVKTLCHLYYAKGRLDEQRNSSSPTKTEKQNE